MTIEHSPAATAVLEREPDPTTSAQEQVHEPDSKEPLHIPTEEEVKENGLYYSFLSERDRALYKAARKTEGLRDEIAMLRIKIAEFHFHDPLNLAMILRAMSLLEKLLKTHYRLFVQLPQSGGQTAVNPAARQFSPPNIPMNRKMLRALARAKR